MKSLNFSDLSATEFEEFTFQLLARLGFINVDWRKGTGHDSSPADSGRDIVCQHLREDVDKSKYLETWFVDCKHYRKGVPPQELQSLLAWAEAERPETALVVTSGFLSNPAKDYLEKYKQNRKPPFRIKYWEKPQLEKFGSASRTLLLAYNLLADDHQEVATAEELKERFITKLKRIREATAFGTSRNILVDDIFVDVFFRPRFSLAAALDSRWIPNVSVREVLCSQRDYDDFIADPFVAVGPAQISDVPETERQAGIEKEKTRLSQLIEDAKSKGDVSSQNSFAKRLVEIADYVFAQIDLTISIEKQNKKLTRFKKVFRRMLESRQSPEQVRRIIKEGVRLGAHLATFGDKRVAQEFWPELLGSAGDAKDDWHLPGQLLIALRDPIIVFGPPGAGKTTLLKWIAIQTALRNDKVMPIFLQLGKLEKPTFHSICSACKAELSSLGMRESTARIRHHVLKGAYRLFLDGLDEMGSRADSMYEAIRKICNLSKNVSVVISSRDFHQYSKWSEVLQVKLLLFSDKQVTKFVKKWFRSDIKSQSTLLEWLKQRENIKEIAKTPLILATLCGLVEANADLPITEAELYQRRFDLLLGQWAQAQGIEPLPVQERNRYMHFLAKMGYEAHRNQWRTFEYSWCTNMAKTQLTGSKDPMAIGLITDCLERGLLEFELNGGLSFGHLTYQEFLAGFYLKWFNPVDYICAYLSDPWWTKALEFYAALIGDMNEVLRHIDGRIHRTIDTELLDRLASLARYTPLIEINEAKIRLLQVPIVDHVVNSRK
jgi:hypothetical protein